jgi:hypothetical protein
VAITTIQVVWYLKIWEIKLKYIDKLILCSLSSCIKVLSGVIRIYIMHESLFGIEDITHWDYISKQKTLPNE